MDSISLAELFWVALVVAGLAAELLERGGRRRAVRFPVRTDPAPADPARATPAPGPALARH